MRSTLVISQSLTNRFQELNPFVIPPLNAKRTFLVTWSTTAVRRGEAELAAQLKAVEQIEAKEESVKDEGEWQGTSTVASA